jgi:hypothetical protein
MNKLSISRIALGDSPDASRRPPATIARRHRVRELAREAERHGHDGVALDLFFAAARIETTGRVDAVRAELATTATEFAGAEARLYRRAARLLTGRGPPSLY